MSFREQRLGAAATFLVPSLKLREPVRHGSSPESRLHEFLMRNFGGYTAQAGNIFGFWKDEAGAESYGEHREFTVALAGEAQSPLLKNYLASLAREMKEQCIYCRIAGETFLIYPAD
jgi:hypothetical protein